MRDQFAPMIEGFDLNGIVDPYSFQCTPFYIEGDNGGTLMDGTTIHDILEEKVRLSWTFNALYIDQYTALSDALNSGESPDTVTAYAYDLTRNAVILAKFHASLPEFNFVSAYGQTMCISNGELVLEEAELLGWFVITPPTRTTYHLGESLDLSGFTVKQYDKDGNGTNITAQCTISAAESTELMTKGKIPVSALVTVPGRFVWALSWLVTVTSAYPIASGNGWTVFNDRSLYIYLTGRMPSYSELHPGTHPESRAPWHNYDYYIERVIIKNSVTSIGSCAFYAYPRLASVTIPDSVTYIGHSAFYHCTSLTSITIPDSITYIGGIIGGALSSNLGGAFEGCTSLTSITIPDSVTYVGDVAFRGCTSLASVTMSNSVTEFGICAFKNCTSLASITIPNSVTKIGDGAFEGCASLTSITIPKSVTYIGKYPFKGCESLTSVTVPGTASYIAGAAQWSNVFNGCDNLTDLTILDGSFYVDFCDNFNTLVNVTIPNSVTRIESSAFAKCTSLASVVMSDSVTKIGETAFFGCTSLTSITIPDSVTEIGNGAFEDCASLAGITIPDSVTKIGNYAFENCTSLTSITIPNITSMGFGLFIGCTSLASVTIADGMRRIGSNFYGCTSLASVTIPNSVVTIDSTAFGDCNNLRSVYYSGTKSQLSALEISDPNSNAPLSNATWYYNSTGPGTGTIYSISVTFIPNGGTGTMGPVTISSPLYTLPQPTFTAPNGGTFKAWSFDDWEYSPGHTLYLQEGAVITALWEVKYIVTFNANGGTGTMEPVTVTTSSYVLPSSAFTPPSGYAFKSWSVNGVEYAARATIELSGDTTVTAIWEETVEITLTINPNNGVDEPIIETEEIPLSAFPLEIQLRYFSVPTAPDGYAFRAWDINGTEYGPTDTLTITDNTPLTFTALWGEVVELTITFNPNNGTEEPESKTVEIPLPYVLPLSYLPADEMFTVPEGYHFKAWNVNGTEYEPTDTLTITDNTPITFTAIWEEDEGAG